MLSRDKEIENQFLSTHAILCGVGLQIKAQVFL